MDFVAIDVETANADLSSICQLGAVVFRHGRVVDEIDTYVDPEDEFWPFNVAIHGITPAMVRGAPTYADIHADLGRLTMDQIVVHHTPFDKVAISRATAKYNLTPANCVWLDSARVARRAWTTCAASGYGLAAVASYLGIQFCHHNAREDARAAGEIVVRAISETDIPLQDWLRRVEQPIDPARTGRHSRRPTNTDGDLAGETLVFTGALSIPRADAADMAASAGARVATTLSKKTTILVVGDQDLRKLDGHSKSSKHRLAEELIQQGCSIRIVGESDFVPLTRGSLP